MDCPSFDGFHAQLGCKLTCGNKNQIQLSLVQLIQFLFKNKTEKNRNDEKYRQNDIAIKIQNNHNGVRATAIMLRSITATSSWRSPVLVVKQASEITSAALSSETMHCVEGHISHSSLILRRCHPEESLCSCEFNRGSFLKHAP